MIERGKLFAISSFILFIVLLVSPLTFATPFFSQDKDIFSLAQSNSFLEGLSQIDFLNQKQKFLDKTIKYGYGNINPQIKKEDELKNYFKKLDLKENYIYTVLQFEDYPNEKQLKELQKDNAKQIGKYGKDIYVYKFPKGILETKTYNFIKWIEIPRKSSKLTNELKEALNLDNSLLIKVKFYEGYSDEELKKINRYAKFTNKDDWEENKIYALVSPKLNEDSIHPIEEIASFNFVKSVKLIDVKDKRKMSLFEDQTVFYEDKDLFVQPHAIAPWQRDERKVKDLREKEIPKIISQKELGNKILSDKVKNNSEYQKILDYSKEIGLFEGVFSQEVVYDDGTKAIFKNLINDSNNEGIIFLVSLDNDKKSLKRSYLLELDIIDNESFFVKMYDESGGVKLNAHNWRIVESWGEHSCGYADCLSYGALYFQDAWWNSVCKLLCQSCVAVKSAPVCLPCALCLVNIGYAVKSECDDDSCYYYPCQQDCDDQDGWSDNWHYYCNGDDVWRGKWNYDYSCSSTLPREGSCEYDLALLGQTELHESCSYGCDSGSCTPKIQCSSNNDCPLDYWTGSTSCSGGDVWQNYVDWSCVSSSCTSYTSSKKKRDCEDGCTNGECDESIGECSNDKYEVKCRHNPDEDSYTELLIEQGEASNVEYTGGICGEDDCGNNAEAYAVDFDIDDCDGYLDEDLVDDIIRVILRWKNRQDSNCYDTDLYVYTRDEDELSSASSYESYLTNLNNWDLVSEGAGNCGGVNNLLLTTNQYKNDLTDNEEGQISYAWWPEDDQDGWWMEVDDPEIEIKYCKECPDEDNDNYDSKEFDCGTDNDCDDYNQYINPGANIYCDCNSGTGGGATQGIDEICDNIDNDCDGSVDEGVTQGCGVGICSGGSQTCISANNWGSCSTNYLSTNELCNGLDDDCDGSVDEGIAAQECGTNVGECVKGTQTCSSPNWGACGGDYVGPVNETCNGLDDNCNGIIDESNVCGDYPGVTISNPANNYLSYTGNVTFTCTVLDDENLSNITLYHSISGNMTSNETINLTGTSDSASWTISNIQNNTNFIWNCLAYDNDSHWSWSENGPYSVNVSIRPPPTIDLELIYPTTNMDGVQNEFFNVTVNVTCRTANCGQIDVSLDPKNVQKNNSIKSIFEGTQNMDKRGYIGESGIEWIFEKIKVDELDGDIEYLGENTFKIIPISVDEIKTNKKDYNWKTRILYDEKSKGKKEVMLGQSLKKKDLNKEIIFTIPEGINEFTFYFGETSTQIDATAASVATSYGPNENICQDNNGILHVAYEGGSSDLWYANNSGGTWSAKELMAGTVTNVGIICSPNDDIIVYYINAQDLDMHKSTNKGISFTGPITVEDDVDVFDGPISGVVDSGNIIHWCLIDNDDDLIYVNSDNLDGGSVISSADSDHCDIEVDTEDNVYIAISESSTDDLDIMTNKDSWNTRTSINNNLGAVSSYLYSGLSMAIDANNKIHIASIHGYDLQYCNGTTSLNSWSCQELDSSPSMNPDIAVTNAREINIFYQRSSTDGDIYRANSSDWINFDARTVIQSSSSWASIAQSQYATSNDISETLHYVYTDSSDVYYDNFSVSRGPKGLISTIIGDKPFYTNESNPRIITLNKDQSQLVTFWVNTTGSINSVYEFFAFVNLTSDNSMSNITNTWEVTIVDESENETQEILLGLISPITNTNVTQNEFFRVVVNVTCANNDCGEINVSFDPVQNTGYQSPGTIVEDSSFGNFGWANEGNAGSSDNNYATSSTSSLDPTYYLKATNFNFNIPSGATIEGIEVQIEHKADYSNEIEDEVVKLVKGGVVQGSNKASQTDWSLSDETFTYGGSSDMWGLTFSESDIENSNFGIVLSADIISGGGYNDVLVDNIQIKVYYTTSGEENGTKGLISTTIGNTPFYTNESNPRVISLNEGQSQLVTAWINATGESGSNHTFFVYANKTSSLGISNITDSWTVMIVDESENETGEILLDLVNPLGSNINVTQNEFFNVLVNVTCKGVDCGEINVSLDPKELNVNAKENKKYASFSETICSNGICNKKIYSGVKFVKENENWKKIEDISSLKDKGFNIKFIENDPNYPLKIIDFNYTHIKIKLDSKLDKDTGLKIWKYNSIKGKKIKDKKNKELKNYYKESYDKIKEKKIKKKSFGKEYVFEFRVGEILEFGDNSTTIQYNFNSTFQDDEMWANMIEDLGTCTNPPASGNDHIPTCIIGDGSFYGDTGNALDSSDNSRFVGDSPESDMLKVNATIKDIEISSITQLNWTFEGQAYASGQPIEFYMWNFTDGDWYNCASDITGGTDVLRNCVVTDTNNFIDSNNKTYFIAYAGASGSDGDVLADFVKLEIIYSDNASGNSSTYNLEIVDPTTSNTKSVNSGDNITLRFNFLENGTNVTSGVTINNITIGGVQANVVQTSGGESCVNETETFESSFLPTGWTTGGDANFFKSSNQAYGGTYSAEGGNIDNNEDTWIRSTKTFCSSPQGGVEFNWKVNSEGSWDYLGFCGENTGCTFHGEESDTSETRISGSTSWASYSNLSSYSGETVLEWAYRKDSWTSTGSDTGWVDSVTFYNVEGNSSASDEFEYIAGVGWEVNVTVPTFASGLKDLFINVSYDGNVIDDLEINAINYGGSSETKSGLISTVVGTTPFYTNDSNPRTINLNKDQSQLVLFWVNATGDLSSTHEFFAFVNKTSNMALSNITNTWDVTII